MQKLEFDGPNFSESYTSLLLFTTSYPTVQFCYDISNLTLNSWRKFAKPILDNGNNFRDR